MNEDILQAVRQVMVDNYAILEKQVARLTQELVDNRVLTEGLVRENAVLRDELDRRTKDFQRVQGYAVRLSTQLEGVRAMLGDLADRADKVADFVAGVEDQAQKTVAAEDWPSRSTEEPAGASAAGKDAVPPAAPEAPPVAPPEPKTETKVAEDRTEENRRLLDQIAGGGLLPVRVDVDRATTPLPPDDLKKPDEELAGIIARLPQGHGERYPPERMIT